MKRTIVVLTAGVLIGLLPMMRMMRRMAPEMCERCGQKAAACTGHPEVAGRA